MMQRDDEYRWYTLFISDFMKKMKNLSHILLKFLKTPNLGHFLKNPERDFLFSIFFVSPNPWRNEKWLIQKYAIS